MQSDVSGDPDTNLFSVYYAKVQSIRVLDRLVYLEMNVASLYKLPETSSPEESPAQSASGPLMNNFAGLIHYEILSQ